MSRRGRPRHPDILTPREWQVVDLLDEGFTNEQIAARLGISFDGAKFHVAQILGKLGVSSRREAASAAYGHKRGPLTRLTAALPLSFELARLAKVTAGTAVAAGVAAVAVFIYLVLTQDKAVETFDMYPGLYVLDIDSGQVHRKADLRSKSVDSFDWAADGLTFVVTGRSENDSDIPIEVLDASTGAKLRDETLPRGENLQPSERRWPSPDGALYALLSSGGIDI